MISPELNDIESFLWSAFWDLSTDRQGSMGGKTPIPWSSIHRYGQLYAPDMAEFAKIIQAMDSAYLSHESGDTKVFSREMFRR